MIDKGKYASHGAFIKRLPPFALAQRQKPKLAVIHPLPSNQPRTPNSDHELHGVVLQSKTLSTKFRFQENIDRKPVAQEYVQPFLYIEKVIKKQKLQQKLANLKVLEPFITSSTLKPRKTKHEKPKVIQEVPEGFKNLFEYEEQRKTIANKLFQKFLENDVHNLKDMFLLWSGKAKKTTPEIDIKEEEFVNFIKEVLPGKLAEKQVKRFFELYMNKPPKGKEKDDNFRTLSIKAFSFNYEKYWKNQMEVANVLSEKALKERYLSVKNYLIDFDTNYRPLKEAMESIKNYEESLKNHFRQLYSSYKNPYEAEIQSLNKELEKPIIKYDKMKKGELTAKVEALTSKHEELHAKLTADFEQFCQQYEAAVLTNHDLFFTKRTLCKLILPLLHSHPTLTKRMIEEQIALEQSKKEQYLQCLSELVVEMDKDKKHLAEDCFTLDEFVQLVLMKNKKNKGITPQFSDQFLLYSSKKLIKQVKKQFLLKYKLSVDNMDLFPADQEISLDLLHTCFEMECTKVLLKNQIWTQIMNFIPSQTDQKSKLHQHTIDANICLELLKRYFTKLDERMKLQLNKSKQISLIAENVTLEQFGMFATVFEGVLNRLDSYVEDEQEEADIVEPLQEGRKVTFADIVSSAVEKNNFPQKVKQRDLQKERENQIIKSLIKSIFQEEPKNEVHQEQQHVQQSLQTEPNDRPIIQNLGDINTLAKSFFVPEGLNTNSFDIRYYQKQKAKAEKNAQPIQPQVIRMGSSVLLSNLPHVEEIESTDPLKISRLLMTNIDKGVKQQRRVIRGPMVDSNIAEGVSHNYYKDKIKLQNKPTVYDSEGRSKYSVLLPVGYYEDFVAAQNIPDNEKWYLRPHHVETLTENPLSKKDNVIHTEYQSKLDKLPPKKRPDEYVIEENVKRKSDLIESLEDRISSLKKDLEVAQRGSRIKEGAKVPPAVVDNYLSKLTENKEDKQLEIASYEGVLYDLRRKERELLNNYRNRESSVLGEPEEKWWERKDKQFNVELKKQRLLVADNLSGSNKHRQYVDKLKNSEIY